MAGNNSKKSLRERRDKYQGRPIAVLGGGPSLPADLRRIPAGTVLVAVNDHAFHHCRPDYMVFCDRAPVVDSLFAAQEEMTGRRLCIYPEWCDFELDVEIWYSGISASLATWFACWLTSGPVLLCGFDLYQTPGYYCHDGRRNEVDMAKPLENHLLPWQPVLSNCHHSERIRAVSGPLTEMFGRYDGGRKSQRQKGFVNGWK